MTPVEQTMIKQLASISRKLDRLEAIDDKVDALGVVVNGDGKADKGLVRRVDSLGSRVHLLLWIAATIGTGAAYALTGHWIR